MNLLERLFLWGGLLAVGAGRETARGEGLRRWARAVAGPTLAATPALVPAVFFRWQFGVFNLSVRPNEALASLSFRRGFDLVFDPNLGVLPHAPVTLLLAVVGALVALARVGSGLAFRISQAEMSGPVSFLVLQGRSRPPWPGSFRGNPAPGRCVVLHEDRYRPAAGCLGQGHSLERLCPWQGPKRGGVCLEQCGGPWRPV